jgi:hypothetical protein
MVKGSNTCMVSGLWNKFKFVRFIAILTVMNTVFCSLVVVHPFSGGTRCSLLRVENCVKYPLSDAFLYEILCHQSSD